jgi:hypothetical protein
MHTRQRREAKRARAASRRAGRGTCLNADCGNAVVYGSELCVPCTVVARLEAERIAAPRLEAERIAAENAAHDAAAAASTSTWELPDVVPRWRPPIVVVEESPPPPPPQEEPPLFADVMQHIAPPGRRIIVTPPAPRQAPAPTTPPAPIPVPAPPPQAPPNRYPPLRDAMADNGIPTDMVPRVRALRRRVEEAPLNTAAKKLYDDALVADIVATANEVIARGGSQANFSRATNLPQPSVSNWRRAAREGLSYRNPPHRRRDEPRLRTPRASIRVEEALAAPRPTLAPVAASALPQLPTTPPPKEPTMPAPTTIPTKSKRTAPNGKPTSDTLHRAVASLLDLEEIGAMDAETVVASLRGVLARMDG